MRLLRVSVVVYLEESVEHGPFLQRSLERSCYLIPGLKSVLQNSTVFPSCERCLRGWKYPAMGPKAERKRSATFLNRYQKCAGTSSTSIDYPCLSRPFGTPLSHMESKRNGKKKPMTTQSLLLSGPTPPVAPTVPGSETFPTFSTPFIGREHDIITIHSLLRRREIRLLTLLGTGGIGKTRLGIHATCSLGELFPDGLYFISLVSVRMPDLVMDAIARILPLQLDTGKTAFEQVKTFIGMQRLLLFLDNVEQVVSAAPLLEQLLVACPGLTLLVTSRLSLGIQGESRFHVSLLPVPAFRHDTELLSLAHNPCVAIFVQQARALLPSFQLTQANAASIAAICARLDGLPLAIELAAARVLLLPPPALLARLVHCLPLLTKRDRTRYPHQQTLRATIQWSYDLLPPETQCLFRWLAVFVGNFSLETVEQLALLLTQSHPPSLQHTVLDHLDILVDNCLLLPPPQDISSPTVRLSLLETLREFAYECLIASGEITAVRQAHATVYLELVEQAASSLHDSDQAHGLQRIEREYENVRAAMVWLLEPEEREDLQKKTLALRLGSALYNFWLTRGYLHEGRKFLEQALSMEGEVALPIQARAWLFTASLIMRLGDLSQAAIVTERSLTLFKLLKDQEHCAILLRQAGWIAQQQGKKEQASHLYQEGLRIALALDHQQSITNILFNMAFLAEVQGAYQQAQTLYVDVLARQRALHNRQGIIHTLYQLVQVRFFAHETPPMQELYALLDEGLALAQHTGDTRSAASLQGMRGQLALHEGQIASAHTLIQECLDFHRNGGDRVVHGHYLVMFGCVAIAERDYATAHACFEESLAISKALGDDMEIDAYCLEAMASLALTQGQHCWAVQLWSTAARLREEAQYPLHPVERRKYEEELAQVKHFLGEERFVAVWQHGRTLTKEEVIAARWQHTSRSLDVPHPALLVKKAPSYPAGLSNREVQVLRLVAQGLTDAQVADQLIISPRTVTTHLTSIYNKLGVNSRAAATRFAVEHALL